MIMVKKQTTTGSSVAGGGLFFGGESLGQVIPHRLDILMVFEELF